MTNSYCKHICSFCGKITSASGFPKVGHYRKHVREGIAFEVGPLNYKYRGVIEFINLRYYAKIGTMPGMIIFKDWYRIEKGRKVFFRYEKQNDWIHGIIDDMNENCIFIELI